MLYSLLGSWVCHVLADFPGRYIPGMKCFRPIRSLVTLKFPAIDNIFHIFFCCQKLRRGGGGQAPWFFNKGGGGAVPPRPPPWIRLWDERTFVHWVLLFKVRRIISFHWFSLSNIVKCLSHLKKSKNIQAFLEHIGLNGSGRYMLFQLASVSNSISEFVWRTYHW